MLLRRGSQERTLEPDTRAREVAGAARPSGGQHDALPLRRATVQADYDGCQRHAVEQLLADFPHLEEADIREALAFAARVVEKREVSGEDLPRVAIAWTEGELNGLGELLSVS
jgi:hypothetical protein